MHNRKDTDYKDYLNDVVADLDETMKMAKEAGIKKKRSCWIQGLDLPRILIRI